MHLRESLKCIPILLSQYFFSAELNLFHSFRDVHWMHKSILNVIIMLLLCSYNKKYAQTNTSLPHKYHT